MLITVAWVACGVFAYGLMKGAIINRVEKVRKYYSKNKKYADYSGALKKFAQFTADDEMSCVVAFALGPISLISIVLAVITIRSMGGQYKISFRFRVPKELQKSV